jgi:DNA-binding transcriptional regulator LsrR (DeoR family)
MPRRPATITQADVARVIRAARQEGAVEVEVRVGDQASFLIRIAPSTDPPFELPGESIL